MLFTEDLSIVQNWDHADSLGGALSFGDGAKLVAGMKAKSWGIKMLFLSSYCSK